MNTDEYEFINCPYCWQQIEIAIERINGDQEYVEDCHICCRPILFNIQIDEDGECEIQASMDE